MNDKILELMGENIPEEFLTQMILSQIKMQKAQTIPEAREAIQCMLKAMDILEEHCKNES